MFVEPPAVGAFVEIIEHYGNEDVPQEKLDELPVIKPRRVRINGTDVGLLSGEGGIKVDVGDGNSDPVRVTLTLLARRVEIKAE